MRFAILAFDLYLGVFETLLNAGWTPVKVFTWPTDQQVDRNVSLVARATGLKLPVQLSPILDSDLQELGKGGCDALIGAGYPWKVGNWAHYMPYGLNFHPSPLPEGRGPYPSVQAIRENRREWAVSCHKFAPDFDTGDLLAQDRFALDDDECHEKITLKIQMSAKRLAVRVANDLPQLWDKATPQSGGSYWKRWSEQERTLDFTRSVDDVMRVVRAFGHIECIAFLNGYKIFVRKAVGWCESHHHTGGTIVHTHDHMNVVAVNDGYIGLIHWSYIDPSHIKNMGR
jgi:methionyl-tRNA formyltransferase